MIYFSLVVANTGSIWPLGSKFSSVQDCTQFGCLACKRRYSVSCMHYEFVVSALELSS